MVPRVILLELTRVVLGATGAVRSFVLGALLVSVGAVVASFEAVRRTVRL
jgi:hypothetical protein